MARCVLLLLLAALFPAIAHGQPCRDPLRLTLHVRAPAPPGVIEHTVAAADIEKLSVAPARHALMAINYALDVQIAIAPLPIAACGSSAAIVVTFGVGRREVFLAREAAAVPCVHRALLAHEGEHSRITTEGARRFIERHRPELRRAIDAALEPLAGDPTLGSHFKAEVLGALRQLSAEFLAEARGSLRDAGDSPAALAALAAACGGALGTLDQAVRQGTAS